MRVLIACEESQAICVAFRDKGCEAYSCDLKKCSGDHPEWHIQGNVTKYIDGNAEFTTMDGVSHYVDKWDLIIAHPPCTYLSKAGARWMFVDGEVNERRLLKAKRAKRFFMKFYNLKTCDKVVIENPVPLKIVNLPAHDQTIEPYQFGHPYSKETLLWLKGVPPLVPTDVIDEYTSWTKANGRAKTRAKTFSGIAEAMADQWSKLG